MTTPRTVRLALAATTIAASLTAAGTMTAAAAATPTTSPKPTPSTTTLAALKARCNTEVQRRIASLNADRGFIQQATNLTDADRTALLQIVTTDVPALTALDATIQSDTTLDQARSDCRQIVTGFRVYVLQEPKMHGVIAADAVTVTDSSLRKLAALLAADINAANLPPAQKQAAQEALDDLYAKVAASEAAIGGVSASLLPLTPAGYPAPDVTVLKAAQQSIRTARTDLDGARHDVDTILHLLGR
ncbi:MAG TPA: hypothetical protein VH134_09770 [Candidatus Dormibacteraeota bacterium]|nr:hypothetical protein [Candidatus Dormibacteraeota bacterium]